MKRVLLVLITLMVGKGFLFAQPGAEFKTEVNKTGTLTIVAYTGAKKSVVIPETIGNDWITKIGDRAFNELGVNKVSITSVTIPSGVTEIGKNAFPSSLVSVTIGKNVQLSEYTPLEETKNTILTTLGMDGVSDDSSIGNGFEAFYKKNKRQAGTYKRRADSTDWSYATGN